MSDSRKEPNRAVKPQSGPTAAPNRAGPVLPQRDSARARPAGPPSAISKAVSGIRPISTHTPASLPRQGSGRAPSLSGLRPGLAAASGGTVRPNNTWKCIVCGKMLGPEAVSNGSGTITDGRLWCVDCFSSGGKKRKPTAEIPVAKLAIAGAGVAVLLGALAIPFPGPVLFIAIVIGGLTVLGGGLAFNASGFARLSTVLVGLIIVLGSMYGLSIVSENNSAKTVQSELEGSKRELEELLANSAYSEALVRLAALDQRVQNPKGGYVSGEAAASIQQLKKVVDDWVESNFGKLSADERKLLDSIASRNSIRTSGGMKRVRQVAVSGSRAQVSMAFDTASTPPPDKGARVNTNTTGDPVKDEIQRMATSILDRAMWLDAVEIKPFVGASESDLKEMPAYALDRDGFNKLKRGAPPAAAPDSLKSK